MEIVEIYNQDNVYIRSYSYLDHGDQYLILAQAFITKHKGLYKSVEPTPPPAPYDGQFIYVDYVGVIPEIAAWENNHQYKLNLDVTLLALNEDDHSAKFLIDNYKNGG